MSDDNNVVVWDIFIRIFHWSLVISVAIAYFSSEYNNPWHIYFGYTVSALVIARLVWGVVGSGHARFSDFLRSPATVYRYLREVRTGTAQHYLGHNPLRGGMVLALLTTLLLVCVSGLKVYAIEEARGPLASEPSILNIIGAAHAEEDDQAEAEETGAEELWEEIHEASSNFMLLLIALHIAGVVICSRLHGENLVKAMLTGNKARRWRRGLMQY